jgi:hypothetical protein
VSPVKYEMGFYIAEDGILHSHCRDNRKSHNLSFVPAKRNAVSDFNDIDSLLNTAYLIAQPSLSLIVLPTASR